jgi:glycosyltransferase involved in cell wall biosynthesis
MASGLPVVASDVGGVGEIVRDGETGILVRPGSVSSVVSALFQLLGDDALSRRMGEAARTRVLNYSWETAATSTYGVYSSVVRGAA